MSPSLRVLRITTLPTIFFSFSSLPYPHLPPCVYSSFNLMEFLSLLTPTLLYLFILYFLIVFVSRHYHFLPCRVVESVVDRFPRGQRSESVGSWLLNLIDRLREVKIIYQCDFVS